MASLGDRPWVSTLIKRVAAYAIKIDADLLVAGDASQCYTHEEGDNGCAKAFKLIVLLSSTASVSFASNAGGAPCASIEECWCWTTPWSCARMRRTSSILYPW